MRTISIPGDKSISHRFLILASLSNYTVEGIGCLQAADTMATASCLREMGVPIKFHKAGVTVEGVGLHGLVAPKQALDCGNSGTTMRLLMGVLAGQSFASKLVGDSSLSRRPMRRIIEPLRQMGAIITAQAERGELLAPINIQGQRQLMAIDYCSPIASAQVKTALLLAGLYTEGRVTVKEPVLSRDHTERLLASPLPTSLSIPGDFSAAAFHLVKQLLAGEGKLKLLNVGVNPSRTGLLSALIKMGANIHLVNERTWHHEPVADLIVTPSNLKGIAITMKDIPSMIDELPILAIAAASAKGNTVVTGAAELRVKESDRIKAIVSNLQQVGIKAVELPDGFVIHGGEFCDGAVTTFGDHRIAMAFTIAAYASGKQIVLDNTDCMAVSYPTFLNDIN